MAHSSTALTRGISASHSEGHLTIVRKLGPMPRRALAALQDYGLDDDEIARYLGLSCASVRRLCRTLGVETDGSGGPRHG